MIRADFGAVKGKQKSAGRMTGAISE